MVLTTHKVPEGRKEMLLQGVQAKGKLPQNEEKRKLGT